MKPFHPSHILSLSIIEIASFAAQTVARRRLTWKPRDVLRIAPDLCNHDVTESVYPLYWELKATPSIQLQ